MEQKDVKRLIALSTTSFPDKQNDKFSFISSLLITGIKCFQNQAYQEIVGSGEAITTSNLDWTIFRVYLLTNSTADTNWKAGHVGTHGLFISRKDIAKFCIDEVENNEFAKKMPVIYSE
ncbi:hypothetical protein K7432_015616 [Basidiobolus ranarum]|uniref:NAD(P)-binding domain-containing protein n=1 Tax=Basidiobolus ranarum TaxID=34480 RepID=A0ABR2VMU4_9FUNG